MSSNENISIDNVIEDIRSAFRNQKSPDYSFVEKQLKKKPYNLSENSLECSYAIREITDINEDHSFRYVLKNNDKELVLEISMVGKYACVLIKHNTNNYRLSTSKHLSLHHQELYKFLKNNELIILPKEILEQPYSLNLNFADNENVKIYQALFTDTDYLPWESSLNS